MTFSQFFLVLRARWLMILIIIVVVFSATLAISLLLPKQYTAEATVVVNAKAVDPITGVPSQALLLPSYTATQIDIIKSDRVAQRVVAALKLDQLPSFREQWQQDTKGRGSYAHWIGELLVKRLEVKPSPQSNVLNISYQWPDPKAAAALANAFTQAYIDTNLDLGVEPAKQYASFFEERGRVVRAQLEQLQKKLSDFQRENGITVADERLDIESGRLNELSSQLVAIQAQRMDSDSRNGQTSNKESLPEVLQNSLIAGLKADLARVEARREDVVVRLGKNHPEYQRTESEIGSLRERVATEINKIVSSMGTNNRVNKQRESEIRDSLAMQKKKVLDLKNQRDQLTVLQNDVMSAQRNYDSISQRLSQTSLESLSQQTNIFVLNPATEPIKPSSPRTLLNTALGLIIGVLLAIFTALVAELRDQRVRSGDELAHLLLVPVLSLVPAAPRSSRKFFGVKRRHAVPG